jgi:uncharacterized protein YlxP (DUF503 family)
MVVGTLQVVLSLPGNDSLKGKRAIVRRTLERARSRLRCAAAEVDAQDEHRRAVLGFAVVTGDRQHARSMLDTLARLVASATEAEVTDTRVEVFGASDDFGVCADARWVRRGASRARGRPEASELREAGRPGAVPSGAHHAGPGPRSAGGASGGDGHFPDEDADDEP